MVNRNAHFGLLLASLLVVGCNSQADVAQGGEATASTQTSTRPVALPAQPARAFNDRLLVADNQIINFNVLDNDEHNDGAVTAFGVHDDGPVGATVQGEAGGQATIQSNGLLTYTPPPGDAPFLETFRYTVKNATGTATASVQVERKLQVYLDNTASAGGNGSKSRPFNTLRDALNAIKGQQGQINVSFGFGESYGTELDEATLETGQAIVGLGPSNNPPILQTHLNVSTFDCLLANLRFEGTGDARPLVSARGNSVRIDNGKNLIMQNLYFESSGGDGISLMGATTTDLTNISMTDLNRSSGSAGLKIANPLGTIRVNKLVVMGNNVGGILLQSGNDGPVVPGSIWGVEFNDITMSAVRNAFQVTASAGGMDVRFTNAPNLTNLSGTMLGGDISGSETKVNCRFDKVNLKGIGTDTQALNWVYRGTSQGILRLGETNPETTDGSTSNNPLNVTAQDSARAAFVSKNSRLYPGRNQLNILAQDNATLQLRYENYGWTQETFLGDKKPGSFNVKVKVLNRATMQSHVAQEHYTPKNAVFRFDLDQDATHYSENFDNWRDQALPDAVEMWGWSFDRRRYVDALRASFYEPSDPCPYKNVPNGSQGIPDM